MAKLKHENEGSSQLKQLNNHKMYTCTNILYIYIFKWTLYNAIVLAINLPISEYATSGFSSAVSMAIELSASGGSTSTRALECL